METSPWTWGSNICPNCKDITFFEVLQLAHPPIPTCGMHAICPSSFQSPTTIQLALGSYFSFWYKMVCLTWLLKIPALLNLSTNRYNCTKKDVHLMLLSSTHCTVPAVTVYMNSTITNYFALLLLFNNTDIPFQVMLYAHQVQKFKYLLVCMFCVVGWRSCELLSPSR